MTILAPEQSFASKGINEWIRKADQQHCTLVGYAGTGKTFLVNYIIEESKLKPNEVAFTAFTGKASLVLKTRNRKYNCSTIHRLIYDTEEGPNGPVFVLKNKDQSTLKNLKLIIVDEASMVPKKIFEDLISLGIQILFIGDEGQLPPIGSEKFNVLENPNFRLTQIHRQAEGNPIIWLSMLAREGKTIKPGKYGKNVFVFGRGEAKKELIDKLYLRSDQILCGYNSSRKKINERVRELKGYTNPFPEVGDKLITLKNSWDNVIDGFPLINGMTGFVEKVSYEVNEKDINIDSIKLDFRPDFLEDQSFKGLIIPKSDFASKDPLQLSREEFSLYERADYGYCITTHKSQGSQYPNLFVRNEILDSKTHNQWLYTAITRAEINFILDLFPSKLEV